MSEKCVLAILTFRVTHHPSSWMKKNESSDSDYYMVYLHVLILDSIIVVLVCLDRVLMESPDK